MPRARLFSVCCLIGLFITVLGGQLATAQTPEDPFNRDPWPEAKQGPVKVFLLAGQSNMQGQAALRTLEYLIYNEETAADYQQWKDRMGQWTQRNDVWVWTTDGLRSGSLKPGFGASEQKLGPELGFGWVVGEQLDEQVLLIKTCWGGKNVKCDFLSPGSPMPSDEALQEELAKLQKRNPDMTLDDVKARYSFYYRAMIDHTRDVLANLKEHFPGYDEDRGYELAGLVWFQGWNDMVDGDQRDEQYAQYTTRLAQMIKDVRKDLNAPDLPVVIGELGANGIRGDFQKAQQAVAELPELAENVRFVKTCEFWDPEVEKMVSDGIWHTPDWVRFYNVGSDKGYHYLGSAKIYYQMGTAFGQSMIEMLEK